MVLTRKEIMHLTKKEQAFHEISMHTDWSNHRKAAERSSWKKKHEPDTVVKCPNRGKRHKKKQQTTTEDDNTNQNTKKKPNEMRPLPPEEDDLPCSICHQSSDGYDFPCNHPICYPCFQQLFLENDGHMICPICKKDYTFHDGLVDEDEEELNT